ncbi:rCG23833 [Rattus norvegicus]|uniref:RCG23833 n=1 Tax=Rattus norvegicus TaxID=10116 RepID=A6JWG2_RAT|nr:rCG23833 [Rattus norvegicus]
MPASATFAFPGSHLLSCR